MDFRYVCFAGLVLLFYGGLSNADGISSQLSSSYARSQAFYKIPDAVMLDKEGRDIDLRQTIDYGGPVMIQFIFATCPTVCPILSASFSVAQPVLDGLNGGVYRLISISIDPEQDRPEKLNEYAKRFKAGNNWYFLTGRQADVEVILKAFDAFYAGNNKMFHKSLIFMRRSVDDPWLRIEGLLGKNEIIEEYKQMIGFAAASE